MRLGCEQLVETNALAYFVAKSDKKKVLQHHHVQDFSRNTSEKLCSSTVFLAQRHFLEWKTPEKKNESSRVINSLRVECPGLTHPG
jgi:hypothetical protein